MSEIDDFDWTTDDIQDLCTMPWHEDLDYGYDKEVARFERWLAEHDRQVAERVWWEACLRIATGENDLDIADIYQRQTHTWKEKQMSEDVVTVLNRRIIELETERDALQAEVQMLRKANADTDRGREEVKTIARNVTAERDALQAKLDKVLEENADLRAEFMDVLNTIGEDDVQD